MEWHVMSAKETAERLGTDIKNGLTEKEAERRYRTDGENKIEGKKRKGIWSIFFSQFADFMIIILLTASAISFATAVINKESDFVDPIVILVIVVLNAIVGTVQEAKAQKALDALKKMSAPTATVIRDGKKERIPSSGLVRGDIIELSAGDAIPADARIIGSTGITTSESALTGESMPCEKEGDVILDETCPPADRCNMLLSSTVMLTGHGTAIVCETGMNTQIGKIAGLLDSEEMPKTPLQEKLAKVSRVLGIGALIICAVIFILGIINKVSVLESFMLSISLAVAAIPEGLPAIVTVVLSLGVQRMAKHGAIITRLPAVETLGGATVICSDKTGTLTQNKMTVTKTVTFSDEDGLVGKAALCCNAKVSGKKGKRTADGEPTENAIVICADERGIYKRYNDTFKRVKELPFDSVRKCMSTLHISGDRYLQITKGAPDILIPQCTSEMRGKNKIPLSEERRNELLRINRDMAEEALRVIAVTQRESDKNEISEDSLTFIGFIGMTDPPRKEAERSVRICKEAGIKPVMITGDHAITAKAVAKKIGICTEDSVVITGTELDEMSEEVLREKVKSCNVFARVTPEHKVRIVKAFRRNSERVAMTGDGVNDAPALKSADIGCAMGQSGTDVAKGAADMILTDDNFATIVKAVAEGRGIFDNIRKAIHFLLSSNIGEIIVIFAASLMKMPTPLLPIQLLWINLVTDSFPALALGTEGKESDIMKRPPRDANEGFFTKGFGFDIVIEGLTVGILTLLSFVLGKSFCDIETGRTMAFITLSFSELFFAVSMRSEKPITKVGLFSNKKMVWAVILCTLLQVLVVTLPTPSSIFKAVPIGFAGWMMSIGMSLVPFIILEAEKLLKSRHTSSAGGRAFRGFTLRLPFGGMGRRFGNVAFRRENHGRRS